MMFDRQGRCLASNSSGLATMKVSDHEMTGKQFRDLWPENIRPTIDHHAKKVLKGIKCSFDAYRINGTEMGWWSVLLSPICDESGAVNKFIAISTDITERKKAEEALRRSEEKYRGLFDSTRDGIFQVNADGIFTLMNMAGARIFGYESPDEIIGRPALQHWRDRKDRDAYRAELRTAKSVSAYPIRARKKNGEPIELESSSRIIEDEQGNFLGIEGILRDVTERRHMEEQLRILSVRDELTGLYNRRGLFTLVEHQLEMANRAKRGLYMLYGDLDNLKMINDTLGHQEGDNALTAIATVLKETYRQSDIIARIGGDEFVVVPAGFAGDNVSVITARLHRSLEIYNSRVNRSYNLSISAGIAYYDPANPCSVDELLFQGDKLMYEEKKRNKKT